MSFQAYIDNIESKTGHKIDEIVLDAKNSGIIKDETKAGELVAWLKEKYNLGHGHCMAVWAYIKGKRS